MCGGRGHGVDLAVARGRQLHHDIKRDSEYAKRLSLVCKTDGVLAGPETLEELFV